MLDPWGPERDNWHAASIAYILAQVHSDPKKAKPKFEDFMYLDPYARAERNIQLADAVFFGKKKGSK